MEIRLLDRLRSGVAGETGLVFSGTLTSGLLNFGAILLAIRGLGPDLFGRLALLTAVMTLTAQFLDFGLSTTFVKYASQRRKSDSERADLILQVTFGVKIVLSVSLLLIAAVTAKPLSSRIFDNESMAPLLFLALAGAVGLILWEFCRGVLQASQRFRQMAILTPSRNLFKLIVIGALFILGAMDLNRVFLATAAAPFVGFFVGWMMIPHRFLRVEGSRLPVLRELYDFTRWVTISSMATMIIMRIDIFMLEAMSTSGQVGYYASANQLAYLFPLITGSITTVLLPRVSRLEGGEPLRGYVRRVLQFSPVVLLVLTPLVLVAPFLIPFLMGSEYVPSVPIFRILILGFAISVIVNPISLIFYNRERADLLAWLNLVQLVLHILLNIWLIPIYGAVGAALGTLAVRVLGGGYIGYFVHRLLGAGNIGEGA
jgi:O-antigen/teichoic acid export membrane protein